MQVTCPACRGRKRMDYLADLPSSSAPVGPEVAVDMVVEVLRNQSCRTCEGEGRIAATWNIAVLQDGRRIGTVPPSFDPEHIESRSPLYRPRSGDFRRKGDVWVASTMLGNGDLEAVPGFVWDRESKAVR